MSNQYKTTGHPGNEFKIAVLIIIGLFVWPVNAYAAQPDAAQYKDTLALASTTLIHNIPNRTDNIILACGMINETVIMPGATFSFNQTVGMRTEARGYKLAPSFSNGQIEDSIGGGICQVASTLYYACLLSDLEIVSRTNHSMFADYIEKPGFDAAVSWGAIDFKFRNNTNNPIKIFAWVEDTMVFVELAGAKTNDHAVSIESKILSTMPFQTIYRENRNLAPGRTKVIQDPHTGYMVETYRVIKDANGNVIKRTLEAKSYYVKTDEIIEYNYQD